MRHLALSTESRILRPRAALSNQEPTHRSVAWASRSSISRAGPSAARALRCFPPATHQRRTRSPGHVARAASEAQSTRPATTGAEACEHPKQLVPEQDSRAKFAAALRGGSAQRAPLIGAAIIMLVALLRGPATMLAAVSAALATAPTATTSVAGLNVPVGWVLGLVGGTLIGTAASLHLLLSGRIMGASGIINGLVSGAKDWRWRAVFLAAMGAVAAGSQAMCLPALAPASAAAAGTAWASASASAVLLPTVAGALTGFGSQMGSGCTSGHGVCGLPRLAVRSFVAVCTFMLTGGITATLTNLVPSLSHLIKAGTSNWGTLQGAALAALLMTYIALLRRLKQSVAPASAVTPPGSSKEQLSDGVQAWAAASAGAVFAVGLAISGMLDRGTVRAFLDPVHAWDPSLAFVMGGAVLLNLATFRTILARPSPVCATCFQVPSRKDVQAELVLGSALFGIGWGLYGLCPAPGVMNIVTGKADVILWNAAMMCGMLAYHTLWKSR